MVSLVSFNIYFLTCKNPIPLFIAKAACGFPWVSPPGVRPRLCSEPARLLGGVGLLSVCPLLDLETTRTSPPSLPLRLRLSSH